MGSGPTVELLYFEGCPHYEAFAPHLDELLKEFGLGPATRVEIVDGEAAITRGFLGSPSVRVNGIDIEPAARERTDFGLQCRLYVSREDIQGAPSDDLVVAAVQGMW
jgi:hypothetical protein